jgi:hypothetical protein
MRGIHVILRVGVIWNLSRAGDFGVHILLRLAEFLNGLSQTPRQFRKFFGAEKKEDNEEDEQTFRAGQIGQ